MNLYKQYGEFVKKINLDKNKTNNEDNSNSIKSILNRDKFRQLVYFYENNDLSGTKILDLETGETRLESDPNVIKPDKEELKNIVINHLISKVVMVEEAKKRNIRVDDSEVDEVVSNYLDLTKKHNPPEFISFVNGLGITLEEYFYEYAYEDYRTEILIKKLEVDIISNSDNYQDGIVKIEQLIEEKTKEFKEKNKELIEDILNSY